LFFLKKKTGMADHLTYGLADMGYNVNKLVPWGPIRRLFPYLLRRVQVCQQKKNNNNNNNNK